MGCYEHRLSYGSRMGGPQATGSKILQNLRYVMLDNKSRCNVIHALPRRLAAAGSCLILGEPNKRNG